MWDPRIYGYDPRQTRDPNSFTDDRTKRRGGVMMTQEPVSDQRGMFLFSKPLPTCAIFLTKTCLQPRGERRATTAPCPSTTALQTRRAGPPSSRRLASFARPTTPRIGRRGARRRPGRHRSSPQGTTWELMFPRAWSAEASPVGTALALERVRTRTRALVKN